MDCYGGFKPLPHAKVLACFSLHFLMFLITRLLGFFAMNSGWYGIEFEVVLGVMLAYYEIRKLCRSFVSGSEFDVLDGQLMLAFEIVGV